MQQEGIEEEIDDYVVPQSLHKKLVESEKVGNQASDIIHIYATLDDQRVDVAGSSNFEDVTSNR